MCRPFANTWWKAWKGWPLFQVDAPTLKNGFGDRSILWCKFLGITLLQLHIRIFNPCGVETLLSVFWFVRIFCPFRSVVVLSAIFLRPFLRKEQKYPAKRTSKCPLIVRGKIILGGNQNEKLLSLPPAVSDKQTAIKTLRKLVKCSPLYFPLEVWVMRS